MRNTIISGAPGMSRSRAQAVVLATMLFAALPATACHTSPDPQSSSIVVSAPANGIVRRVLVDEGATVDKDAAIIEIALQPEQPVAPQTSSAKAEQARAVRAAETDLASAEGEANRTAGELRRIEPLVKRGLASQAELDKARAQSQDAQERLRLAREKVRTAEENRKAAPPPAAVEQVIAVRVPVSGTVSALSVHAGEVVKTGQQLATLASHT